MARKPKQPSKRTTTRKVQATENQPSPTLPDAKPAPEVDETPWGDDGLTLKQRLFVEAYIGPAAGNATRAAQLAGYRDDNNLSLRVTASRTLTIPNVQRAIARAVASKLGSAEWTRAGIAEIANANLADFTKIDADGEPVVDMAKALEGGAYGLVREIKEELIKGGGTTAVIKRSFKLHDRLKALEILAKMNGQLKDALDLTSGGKPIKGYVGISPDDWDKHATPHEPDGK